MSVCYVFKEKGFVGIAWQWVRSERKGDIETAYVSSRITDIEITEEEAVIPSLSQWPTFWQTIRNGLLRRSLEICCELGLFVHDHAKDSRTHIRVAYHCVLIVIGGLGHGWSGSSTSDWKHAVWETAILSANYRHEGHLRDAIPAWIRNTVPHHSARGVGLHSKSHDHSI